MLLKEIIHLVKKAVILFVLLLCVPSYSAAYDMKQAIDDVYGNIYENSETEEALVDYLDKLRPDDSGLDVGVCNYIINLHVNNIYTRLLSSCNNNTLINEKLEFVLNKKFNNWQMITMGNSNQLSINKRLAYNSKTKNVVLGFDRRFKDITIGIAASFDRSCGSTSTKMGSLRDQKLLQYSYLASVYADAYLFGNIFCRAIISKGYTTENVTRFNQKAKMEARYHGKQLAANLSIGYDACVFIFNIEPELIIRFSSVKINQYYNIPVYKEIPEELGEFHDKINNYNTDLGVGINLVQSWVLSECVISPKIRIALYKNLNGNHQDKTNLSFMKGHYDAEISHKKSTLVDYNLGLDFAFKKINISIYYNFAISKNYKENSFATKINLSF